MGESCPTYNLFGYQQIISGMKFSIDQLDEQLKSIDKRMENTWLELKDLCENFSGEKFIGTLDAVDQIFASKILDNSVCSTNSSDSIATICQELVNFLSHHPKYINEIFDALLKVQFKEGLNFPICFKNDELGSSKRKSLFDENPYFNELCALFQHHFLDQLLKSENNGLNLFSSSMELQGRESQIKNELCHYVEFFGGKYVEDKRMCFQRLCLLSSDEHSLILYANSKSIFIKKEIEKFNTSPKEFIKGGKIMLNLMKEEVNFLRLCIGEDDVMSFISTVYIDPMIAALESLAETWELKACEHPKDTKKSDFVEKSFNIDTSIDGILCLQDVNICNLLELFDWLIEADEVLMRIQNSSLRCMVEQERSSIGPGKIKNEKSTELKSALKNSGKTKHFEQLILTSVFRWRSIFNKFSVPLMQSLDNHIKECCRNSHNLVAMPIPFSLGMECSKCSVASKNSIEIINNIETYRSFMKFVSSSDKDLFDKLQKLLFESISENVDMISKKIDKDVSIENLLVILSGIDFLEEYINELTIYLQMSNESINELLHTASRDIVELVRLKFVNIITVSIWPYQTNDVNDVNIKEEKDPEYWIQNWWLQMEWLWSVLVAHCSFNLTSHLALSCLSESLKSFAWHFASKRLTNQEVASFIANIFGLLNRSLDILFRCCRRSEEIIDVCSNDGVIYEIHVSCVALTIILFISAMPLPTLKEMYSQFSTQSKLEGNIGRECQWIQVVKQNWKLLGTKVNQLEVELTYEILFSLLEHYPFEKQHLLLQMMFLHDCHFSIKVLELLIQHEISAIHDFNKGSDDNDDVVNGDVIIEGVGVTYAIHALLSIIYMHQLDEETVFIHVLEEVTKGVQDKILFSLKSTLFRFLRSSLEPVLLSVLLHSLNEMECTSPSTLPDSVSNISYFLQDRLFCGCKPSEVEPKNVKENEIVNHLKIFIMELMRNFHLFPFSISRFCFKFDASKAGISRRNEQPLIIRIMIVALKRVINKIETLNMFSVSQLTVLSSTINKFIELASSSSHLSKDYCWFKEDFMDRIYNFSEGILSAGRDENDPGLGTPRSYLSSLVFETYLHSLHSNRSARRSLDVLTLFVKDNLCQLKTIFDKMQKLEKGTGTIPLDFSSLCPVDGCLKKRGNLFKYNPLKALEVFECKKVDDPLINWNLYSKLDLGLTEVNLPNLLINRPEFRDDCKSDLDISSKEFLDQLKQKHLKNPS